MTPQDDAHLRRAQALAVQARPHCPPNPAVGCVLADAQGRVVGEGSTQPVGQAHAEVMALRDAAARGQATAGVTAYVTLEPCSHHGRTGPCCDALVAAGVRRVVVAAQDPNPRVAGQGLARLRAAGVQVDLAGAGHAREVRELNIGFFTRMLHGRPWVRVKAAASLDGRTALPNGASQWITSPQARGDGHAWRARACAVLSGVGTVLADDPLLNVRLPGQTRQPALALADSRLRTPADARLWGVPGRAVWVYAAAADADERMRARQQVMRQAGAEVMALPDAQGRVDLAAMLADLARREVNELHVEAGSGLNGALLAQGLADELLLYQAPLLLGQGSGLAALGPFGQVAQGLRLHCHEMTRVGPDVRSLWRTESAPVFSDG